MARPVETHNRMLGSSDSLGQWEHVPSRLAFEGSDHTPPLVTIAITTFRRPGFLLESVQSVLALRTPVPLELIVLDNDPDSAGAAALLARFPELQDRRFRYYVNVENIGMYGNVNRCISLATGEWLSILHDDDLLREDFLEEAFAVIDATAGVDGVVAQQSIWDQRPHPPLMWPDSEAMSLRLAGRLVRDGRRGWRNLIGRLFRRATTIGADLARHHRWAGRASRRVRPRTLFWGPVLGNTSGFLFRTKAAKALGGFDPEEFPASDLYFYARFAARFHLRQLRAMASTYRVAENESLKLSTALDALWWVARLQRELADYHPRWWRWIAPLAMERWRNLYRDHWRIDIAKADLETLIGMRLPKDRPRLIFILRLMLHGL